MLGCVASPVQASTRAPAASRRHAYFKYFLFGLDDLLVRKAVSCRLKVNGNRRGFDLHELCSNAQCPERAQLRLLKREDVTKSEKSVKIVYCEMEGFALKGQVGAALHEPIDENCTLSPANLGLSCFNLALNNIVFRGRTLRICPSRQCFQNVIFGGILSTPSFRKFHALLLGTGAGAARLGT